VYPSKVFGVYLAPTLAAILRRADESGAVAGDPTGQRVVSIVFDVNPGSLVWRDLSFSSAFLNQESGEKWDLFFAGVSRFVPYKDRSDALELIDPTWSGRSDRRIDLPKFYELADQVAAGHEDALASSDEKPWRYSGATDVVSFLAYGGKPDWISLIHTRLDLSLTEYTVTMTTTEDDPEFSPGLSPYSGGLDLAPILESAATTLFQAALAAGTTELLMRLIARR
jgi:hypothetical protein